MTSNTSFGPDIPVASLPRDIRQCTTGESASVYQCATGNASTECCDEIMGSLSSSQGWCADPLNAAQTYCACTNAPALGANAACFFSPCANNAFAYQTRAQRDTASHCPPGTVICSQILEIGGKDNVVSNITMQCGIITNVSNIIKASPYLAVLLFVLILTLVMVIAMRPDDAGMRAPPLPPDLAMALINDS